jgi:hypothetical protein
MLYVWQANATHYLSIWADLELKSQLKQLIGSLPFDIAIPRFDKSLSLSVACFNDLNHNYKYMSVCLSIYMTVCGYL